MWISKAAILATLISAATAECTVNTSTNIKYIRQGTVTNPTTISFGTNNGYSSEISLKCTKGGRFSKCDSNKLFCATYDCSTVAVKLYSMTYLGTSLGKGWTRPSATVVSGAYTIDQYWSCY